jgi:hypothetical protein
MARRAIESFMLVDCEMTRICGTGDVLWIFEREDIVGFYSIVGDICQRSTFMTNIQLARTSTC